VVGLTGYTHLASIKGGLMKPLLLAQGKKLKIITKVRLCMQVDGEALIQKPGIFEIDRLESVNMIVPAPPPL
jgi:hypothetical protein